jgi:ABC-2 type transport system ATP-binding protein
VLEEAGYAVKAHDGTIVLTEARAVNSPDDIAVLLTTAGAPPTRLAVEQQSLEDHFLALTGEQQ